MTIRTGYIHRIAVLAAMLAVVPLTVGPVAAQPLKDLSAAPGCRR